MAQAVHADLAARRREFGDEAVGDGIALGTRFHEDRSPAAASTARTRPIASRPAAVSTSWVRTSAHVRPRGHGARYGSGPPTASAAAPKHDIGEVVQRRLDRPARKRGARLHPAEAAPQGNLQPARHQRPHAVVGAARDRLQLLAGRGARVTVALGTAAEDDLVRVEREDRPALVRPPGRCVPRPVAIKHLDLRPRAPLTGKRASALGDLPLGGDPADDRDAADGVTPGRLALATPAGVPVERLSAVPAESDGHESSRVAPSGRWYGTRNSSRTASGRDATSARGAARRRSRCDRAEVVAAVVSASGMSHAGEVMRRSEARRPRLDHRIDAADAAPRRLRERSPPDLFHRRGRARRRGSRLGRWRPVHAAR